MIRKTFMLIAIILAAIVVYLCCVGIALADDDLPICFVTTPDAWGYTVNVCMTEAEAIRLGIITPMPTLDAYPGLETPPPAYPGLDVFSGGEDFPAVTETSRMIIRDNRRER